MLRLIHVGFRHVLPRRQALRIAGYLHFLRFIRKVGIEGAERRVVHSFGQEREGGKELAALLRKGVQGGFEDVVALLDEVEVGEIELAPTG